MEAKKLNEGDIVQVGGHGRAMVVINADLGDDATWEGIPHAVVCEWVNDGAVMHEGYAAEQLEVVGSVARRSSAEVYAWITAHATATIARLASGWQSETAPELIVRRSMAIGALQLWQAQAGPAALDADRERLQTLIDSLPTRPTAY
jgi:hypothetical protein